MSAAIEVKLPETAENLSESLVVFWYFSAGDRVEKGQILLEVQTEKALFEIECPANGKLSHILVPRGGVARVGDVLAVIEQPSDTADVQISPRLRHLAKELKVDISRIIGTGPDGKITEADIRASVKDLHPENNIELTPIRRTIAKKMMQSLQQSAQLTVTAWADVTDLSKQRQELAPGVTWNAWVMRAAVLALTEHPHINAVWEETGIRQFNDVHLGVAVDTAGGLLVPVVRQAQQRSLIELNLAVREIADKAHAGTLTTAELSGSTFTVTNLGTLGIQFFTPILNYPETAILGVGKLDNKLVLEQGNVVEQTRIPLSLTFDHRTIDGAPAARFLHTITELLRHPMQLV